MRIALLGAGRIGASHAGVLAAHEGVDALVVYDADPARAASVSAAVGASCATSVDAALTGVDAVVVAAPTALHAELVVEAVGRGLPVFCEKPVAQDVATTLTVLDAVKASGVAVQIGFQRRFDAGYAAARAALREGRIGDLRRAHLVTCDPAPPPADYVPTSGGIYRDMHVHDLDALRWVTGREVEQVIAVGAAHAAVFADHDDVDETVALLTMDDGTLVTMAGSRNNGAGYDVRMELAGTLGTVGVGLDDRTPIRSSEPGSTFAAGQPWPSFWERFTAAYVAEITAFVEVAAGREQSPCTVTDALEAVYAAEAATRSRQQGRAVAVSEVRAR